MNRRTRPAQLSEPPSRLATELFALLGAPAAWMGTLLVSYATHDVMCDADAATGTLRTVLGSVAVVALLVAATAGAVSFRLRRRPAGSRAPQQLRRSLLATAGVLLSLVFSLAIVLTAISSLFARTC